MLESNPLEVIGKRIGNYVVERSLAQGGMGMVFVARHPALGRLAAVKFLGREADVPPDHARRFLDEACITARLQHPNIVDIFDFGELDRRLYYIMELLEGHDLADVIRVKRQFSLAEVNAYVQQICAGLQAAHAVGIVHRDLKPSNIFVLEGEPLRVKLMDFGVAKVMSASGDQTREGQIIGTPRYMSPEQALGKIDQITPQSDIYSLGVIAYEMLTGALVFEYDSPMMLLVAHIRDVVRPLRESIPELPTAIAELVESCLAKDPAARPQSARALAERFAEVLRNSPVQPERSSGVQECAPDVESLPVTITDSLSDGPGEAELLPRTLPQALCAIVELAPVVENQPEAECTALNPVPNSEIEPIKPAAVAPISMRLTKDDRSTLNKLWLKMQRGGDFPAFVRNVGEVSKRADFESAFSARQLGDSILKDYALTAKLLRVVNSTYANRFGGKIYSVQHAIVILGFDRVRSIALSISLFKNRGHDEQSQRVSESAINSLVSGELTQQLAPYAHVIDEEQAMVCGMFRNLGRHLAIVYLPDLYQQIVTLMQSHGLSQHSAAERVLGLSLQKLGIGIAERWRLPKPILRTMSGVSSLSGQYAREEDRVVELAEFSNELCDIVCNVSEQDRPQVIASLMFRHKNLLVIEQDKLAELLQSVQHSFEQRYASLLGLDTKMSRFSRHVATLVSEPDKDVRIIQETPANQQAVGVVAEAEAIGMPRSQLPASVRVRPARPKPQAQRIQLAKINLSNNLPDTASAIAPDQPDLLSSEALLTRVNELSASLEREGRSERLLKKAILLFAESLGLSRLIVLKANHSRNELVVCGGLRDDIEALTKEFKVPLMPARTATDVFSQAYHQSRDVVVGDAFGARATATVPLRYYETLGSPAFVLYSCASKGSPSVLVLVDVEVASQLPPQQRVSEIADFRVVLARAAP
jgi:serine/threonine-protein kinase